MNTAYKESERNGKLTIGQTAKYLGISRSILKNACDRGEIPFERKKMRDGTDWRFFDRNVAEEWHATRNKKKADKNFQNKTNAAPDTFESILEKYHTDVKTLAKELGVSENFMYSYCKNNVSNVPNAKVRFFHIIGAGGPAARGKYFVRKDIADEIVIAYKTTQKKGEVIHTATKADSVKQLAATSAETSPDQPTQPLSKNVDAVLKLEPILWNLLEILEKIKAEAGDNHGQ